MRDLEMIRAALMTMPVAIHAERLAVLLFIVAEATDLAFQLETLRAQQPTPKCWQVYRWN